MLSCYYFWPFKVFNVSQFLAAGTSLDKWLKAFKCVYYNNCDVIPMIEAIDKIYRARNLDMFKYAISLHVLAYKMLINALILTFDYVKKKTNIYITY